LHVGVGGSKLEHQLQAFVDQAVTPEASAEDEVGIEAFDGPTTEVANQLLEGAWVAQAPPEGVEVEGREGSQVPAVLGVEVVHGPHIEGEVGGVGV